MEQPVLFAAESATSRASALSSERLLNCFIERQPPTSKSQSPIFGAPGLDAFATVDGGPIRGMWNFQGVLYVVSGIQLWSVDSAGNVAQLGTGILGSNPVGMADNGVQLCIVNGLAGYIYTVANGLVQITDLNFFPAKNVMFMDGYFIFDRAGTNEYFLSALYDGTTYNGLDFASAEAKPGFLQTTAQNLQLLFLFCSQHIEIWYDSGANNFPFERYAGGVINYGTESPHTVIAQDGALFFLGQDKIFYRLQANVPIRVSTHPMETIIAADGDLTKAWTTTYSIEGHKFIVLHLPASGRTLAFDISTGKWHERESFNAQGAGLGLWRGAYAIEIYQNVLVGDGITGQIGKMDWKTYTEYGVVMPMIATSITYHKPKKRLFLPLFELDVQPGVGLTSGQGQDPQIFLELSRDGGETFRGRPTRSLGKIGAYKTRVRWKRNGWARAWVLRITITDPVFRCIVQAIADLSEGM